MRTIARNRWLGGAVVALLTLAGCNQDLRNWLQAEIDRIWSDPVRKAQFEDEAERELRAGIERELVGREFEVTGPNPYLHSLKDVRVNLGTTPPQMQIPGQVQFFQTATNYVFIFDWVLEWRRPNGATVVLPLDLRSHAWYLFNGYPDHDVEIRDIYVRGEGQATVVIPTNGTQGTASVVPRAGEIRVTAKAEGWFWTIDVSREIESQLNEVFVRDVVGTTIERTFNATYP